MYQTKLQVTRLDGFNDADPFYETKVFDLYEDLFPRHERDAPADIIKWVLHDDLGTNKPIMLKNGVSFEYNLDSRYFIVALAGRAVGLAFLTYDDTTRLIYANYIAVQQS